MELFSGGEGRGKGRERLLRSCGSAKLGKVASGSAVSGSGHVGLLRSCETPQVLRSCGTSQVM